MPTLHPEFDLLLSAVDPIEGGLACSVLESAGIPTLLQGPDFDAAEFGQVSHAMLRGADLFVPKGSYADARRVLAEAWGEERVARLAPRLA